MVARVMQAVALLREWHAACGGVFTVVTHGLLIRTLIERHLVLPVGMTAPQWIANTSLTMFLAEPPHQVSVINNTDLVRSPLGIGFPCTDAPAFLEFVHRFDITGLIRVDASVQ